MAKKMGNGIENSKSSSTENSENLAKVNELIKDIRTAMMMTLDAEGMPRSRPMHTQEAEFDGVLWFMAGASSDKAREIANDPRVHLSYIDSSGEKYISVTGRAKIVNDRARIKSMWSPFLKAWWDGPDDPEIRLIRVDVHKVEFWDTPGGKIASVLSIVKSVITGTRDTSSENETIDLQNAPSR
jgi:general stress protein 26